MFNVIIMANLLSTVMTNYEYATIILSCLTLATVLIGGGFAFMQWRQGLKYKRSDIVKPLIDNVRSNEKIAMVMSMIDWNKCFYYDGEFHKVGGAPKNLLADYDDEQLFNTIDETLSVFSYICYLKLVGSLKRKDMRLFDYEIRRLFDNKHICNYLFSLFHWSNSLKVHMSFTYLVKYALKKGYLDKTFLSLESESYECFLRIPETTKDKKRKIYL